ncbi:MAG TPA: hypothetical protein VFY45_04760 [Baekduia sp.]|nr:hypothetical protein [Baekduia sp.]
MQTLPIQRAWHPLERAAGVASDQTTRLAPVPERANELSLRRSHTSRERTLATTGDGVLVRPRDEQVVPGARVQRARAREKELGERVTDRADSELVTALFLLQRSSELERLLSLAL